MAGKTILVTGSTGSFGRKFAGIALREFNPKTIRVYSRGEHRQEEVQQEFKRYTKEDYTT